MHFHLFICLFLSPSKTLPQAFPAEELDEITLTVLLLQNQEWKEKLEILGDHCEIKPLDEKSSYLTKGYGG